MPDVVTDAPRHRSGRHQARKRALDLLYQADVLDKPLGAVLDAALTGDDPPEAFTAGLVRGVADYRLRLDRLIGEHARGWRIERMPVVDRNLLRLALYEILHDPEVPASVAIDEAVELAGELSTDDSARFVNGLLGRLAREHGAAADTPVEG